MISQLTLVVKCASCATVNYKNYECRQAHREGGGGSRGKCPGASAPGPGVLRRPGWPLKKIKLVCREVKASRQK